MAEQVDDRLKRDLESIDASIMKELKNFQRATVDHIDKLYKSGVKRVLVADEVGMGKTLIAKGTISKLALLRKEEDDDLIKVIYICSNAAIAAQNLKKLKIHEDVNVSPFGESRLSMQHLIVQEQENEAKRQRQYIQLVPLTPGTSFAAQAGGGIVSERALIYAILLHMDEFSDPTQQKALDELLKYGAEVSWNTWGRDYFVYRVNKCNEDSPGKGYINSVISEIRQEFEKEEQLTLDALCEYLKNPSGTSLRKGDIIAKLRTLFARISIKRLEPDFVVMDEFQRFKFLLSQNNSTETGMLTKKFFESEGLRILLLSATPFQLYTTSDEMNTETIDSSYSEFVEVMRFLGSNSETVAGKDSEFFEIWEDYAIQLKSFSLGANSQIITAKQGAELALRKKVARTERCSTNELAQLVDTKNTHIELETTEGDVKAYLDAQNLIRLSGLSANMPIDYIKSCPFPFSYMKGYKLLDKIEQQFTRSGYDLSKAGKRKTERLWVDANTINNYKPIKTANARFERLKDDVFECNPERLLWVPASLPYYKVDKKSPYYGSEGYSKTLIFSSWAMVPKMASTLLSYEAEQRVVAKLNNVQYRYFKSSDTEKEDESKSLPRGRLKYPDDPAGTLCLMYPSKYLASLFDPVKELSAGDSGMPTLLGLRNSITQVIQGKIDELVESLSVETDGRANNPKWYVVLAMLLDKYFFAEYSDEFFTSFENNDNISSEEKAVICGFKVLMNGTHEELGPIPKDASKVLADMALASPSVCALRIFDGVLHKRRQGASYDILLPFQFGNAFRTKLNTSLATTTIQSCFSKQNSGTHWKSVLQYCAEGNLQAVLDEYAHLLYNPNARGNSAELINQLFYDMVGEPVGLDYEPSLHKTDTHYAIQTFENFKKKVNGQRETSGSRKQLRTNFAGAFSRGEDERTKDRRSLLRNAFNSPFRPFVLISTSIGQEGLDFHNYCRKIVHWNLPSNPIDLEQREGRINRYKNHAIRHNIALRYGDISFKNDIWDEMFETASKEENKKNGSDNPSGLIPYWGLAECRDNKMINIERFVYDYPFSKDGAAYDRLTSILAEYRAVLGQPGQEELLEKLMKRVRRESQDEKKIQELFINLAPFCFLGQEGE